MSAAGETAAENLPRYEETRVLKAIVRALKYQDPERLRDFMRQREDLRVVKAQLGPQTKQELWDTIKERVGVELSTVAVCPGHYCQLDMVWEVYSFAVTNVLWVMNRGAGKTSLAAWMDGVQAEYWPGWASFTIGATSTQGDRKYEYLLPMVVEGGVIGGKELDHVIRSTATVTQYKNGSKNEIALGGTPESANGPRTPRMHRDETELMRNDTYKQAANIPAGRRMRDGFRYAPAQWLDTSTMKGAEGRVDLAIQAYNKAVEEGRRPVQEVRICCIFESAVQNPACRSAPEDERREALIALERDPDELCDCQTWESDVWPVEEGADDDAEPESRTLESVCQGRFFRSRGYKEFSDIQGLFLANDRETWNAEQECAQPSTEGAFIRSYNQTRNGIKGYEPDPENGLIYGWVDWGTGDEAHVGIFQILDRQVQVRSYKGDGVRTLPIGAMVVFAEIYKAGLGNVELGHLVNDLLAQWIVVYPGWRVHEFYPDSANLGARQDWKVICGIETVSRIRKDFVEEVKMVRTQVGKRGGFFVDIAACPWVDKSVRSWKQVKNREVHDFACLPAATMIETERGLLSIEDVEAGDRVWTRVGLRSVLWSGMTKVSETVRVEHEFGVLKCTADHRLWTQRGWVQAQDLTSNDMLLWCRSSERLSYESTSCIGDASFTATRTPKIHHHATTSRAAQTSFTGLSGRTSGVLSFLLGIRYTTSIGIRRITSSATSERSRWSSIVVFMVSILALPYSLLIWREFGRLLSLLLVLQRGENSCGRSRSRRGLSSNQRNARASSAMGCISRELPKPHDSVRKDVRQHRAERAELTTRPEHASYAAATSWSIATPELDTAGVRVLRVHSTSVAVPVYDLHVEDQHEFIADGVLVHNSHAMAGARYALHNLKVVERKLRRAGHNTNLPAAAQDGDDRVREREDEMGMMIRSGHRQPLRAGGEVPVIGVARKHLEREVDGDAGAEDSPLRAAGVSIDGEGAWREHFGARPAR